MLLQAWAEALEEPGPSTTAGCLTRALAACGAPAPEQLVASCARTLAANWAATQELAPEAESTLAYLAERYPLGIITNGPSDAQHAVIAALRLERFFRWRIVSGDATVRIRKPQRGIFDLACAISASQPEHTWYIGDSLVNDIAGAAGAGWRTCWISAPDASIAAGLPAPDARITRLGELPQVISEYE
jgi:HAD superfamily hydrolase (TIGR01549 family)